MRRWLLVLGLIALPSTARADEVGGARSELLVERAHEALIRMEQGAATMRVRRTLHNGGERHDQALIWIDVPDGAVAIGLRTRGTLHGKPHWFSGELMEAERAARMYEELTGIGGYYPKDPALLSWRTASLLALQVFPVAPRGIKQVEYTYQLPVTYSGGRFRVATTLTEEPSPVKVQVMTAARGDRTYARGAPLSTLADAEPLAGRLELELEPSGMHELRGRLGSVPTGERHLIHFEAQAPPRLSQIPVGMHAVILLDASRSRSEQDLEAAHALAQAYLGHLADERLRARVQVIEFSHRLHARHTSFVKPRDASADLEAHPTTLHNGTDLEGALGAAAEWLARAPKTAPRRVLLLSDMRIPGRTTLERAQALARPARALLHAAHVSSGEAWLDRSADDPWAPLATMSGGVVWHATAEHWPADGGEAAHQVFEHLVRPVRLEQLVIDAPGADVLFQDLSNVLDEGEELRVDGLAKTGLSQVELRALSWSTPVELGVNADTDEGTRAAALVFGSDLRDDLSEEEMMTLALRGQVVSPVTSYLAIEPGVRPSTEGLESGEGGLGLGGIGTIGRGAGGGRGSAYARDFNAHDFLERELRARWQACGGASWAHAELAIETTVQEIADILPGSLAGAAPDVAACMRELVWRLELPVAFEAIDRKLWTFALGKG